MLVTVGLIAALLVAGAVIRTDAAAPQSLFGANIGGLRALENSETLVALENYTFDAGGWRAGTNDSHLGLGGILGPVDIDDALRRDIALPEGTTRALLSFDLIAIDDWVEEAFVVHVNDTHVLRQRMSTRPDLIADQTAQVFGQTNIAVMTLRQNPDAERGFGAGGPEMQERVLRVLIAIDAPEDTLRLRLQAEASETASQDAGPLWALDNFTVVAERQP